MKKKFILAIIALLSIQTSIAQSVGIGTASPNPSARLEVNSSTQGILIPTLTSAQRSAISSPATGLLVFQTDGTPGFYYYTGICWLSLVNGHQPNSEGVSSNYGLTTTLAGNATPGAADGTGAAAFFDGPFGIATDISGNVYVADIGNYSIRKITATGVVTTLAGTGLRGHNEGIGTAASFDDPVGVALDNAGNIYVVDRGNNKIRKITLLPNGTRLVSTLAGSGSFGSDDGIGTEASFKSPSGLAVDAAGNVYVADRYSNKIRKISPTGIVTTLAGSGSPGADDATGTAASFREPYGVAVDASGNVYVADMLNHKIRKITATGVVSTLVGSGLPGTVDGTGSAASFDRPGCVTVDAFGNVYVTGLFSHRIRKITPLANGTGVVSTLAGSESHGADDGIGTAASFYRPIGVAVDAYGNLYVADLSNNKIRKIIVQ